MVREVEGLGGLTGLIWLPYIYLYILSYGLKTTGKGYKEAGGDGNAMFKI